MLRSLALVALFGSSLLAQSGLPNPYRPVKGLADGGGLMIPGGDWARLPGGREMGPPASMHVDIDGESIWAFIRCDETNPVTLANGGRFGIDCLDKNGRIKNIDTIYKFNPKGEVVKSFGAGMFIWPHGLHVDKEGNVWATDGASQDAVAMAAKAGGRFGHQVIKFSPDGKVLMRLGHAGMAGGRDMLTEPCDVITAPNGDIFVSDGHSGQDDTPPPGATGRIMKFTRDGKFVKEWGRIGSAPGEFRTPHALAFDSRGRLFVADRGNHRIQIFDQDGKFIDAYEQFSRISGLFIDPNDMLYAIDSESNPENHPGWKTGVRIGRAGEDRVTAFIPPHLSEAGPQGVAGEGVAVDRDGSVYAAEGPISRRDAGGGLTKYLKR